MQKSTQRVIIWLGAIFIGWHVISLLFSGRASQPSRPKANSQQATTKTKGDPQRAAAIVEAFQFSWDKYEKYAAPHDTLLPISKTFENDRNGWGATAVDGLSTAIIMEEAAIVDKILRQIAATNFSVTARDDEVISLFETTIRYLGGLLSDRLSIAFDTPSGIPDDEIIFNPQLRRYGNIDNSITCFGTLVLEWTRLSDLTGNQTYAKLAQRAQDHLIHPKTNQPFTLPGLVGTYVKLKDGYFEDYQAGWGGGSDSYYEYLIKMYAYDPVAFAKYGESWIQAAESSMLYLASSPSTRPDLAFLGEMRGNVLIPISSHLASVCGGSLILGGLLLQNQTFIDFGLKLSESYYDVYRQSPGGIGPELFKWVDDGKQPLAKASVNRPPPPKWSSFYKKSGWYHTNPEYILRPETIESLYYAYRATGEKKWQDWAWEAFESLNRMSKVEGGYTGLRSVMKTADDKTRKGLWPSPKEFCFQLCVSCFSIFVVYETLVFVTEIDRANFRNLKLGGYLQAHGGDQCLPDFEAPSLLSEVGALRESCANAYSYPPSTYRIGTVTAHFGDPQPQYQKALKTHLMQNLVHKTHLDVFCSEVVDGIWNKAALVLSLLLEEMAKPAGERFEWLFWVNRDTLALDPCRPVSSFLPAGTQRSVDKLHLILSKDPNGDLAAGVFLVRVDRLAIDFFSDLLALRHFQPNLSVPLEERTAIEMLIEEARFRDAVVQAPCAWFNAYPLPAADFVSGERNDGLGYNARKGDFLVNFHGDEDEDQEIGEWMDMLERQKGLWPKEELLRNLTSDIENFWIDQGYSA
ncbi:hypothetical protein F53441_10466 [Fusarium austroafricanum]|uniref:alpha-1,2-Mannosidase n=1 Tax=Fusarium austroafricanum TaxID=2364996 RepID=A0A8H4K9G3_9HYPO|nr:hypothetical protein F53441_10466 [Fusarium austroafricanum]